MSDASRAVFLSYARDDVAAARRIAEALRASGLEVWFDENELRGGDAWDAKIRRQIDDCSLFVAIISSHTQERHKGYFRLEWKLAVDETGMLAEGVPFIVPVVIDETRESAALVPAEFMKVQWTRLPGALPTPQFVEQIGRLLRGERHDMIVERSGKSAAREPLAASRPALPKWVWGAVAAVLVGGVALYLATQRPDPAAAHAQAAPHATEEPAAPIEAADSVAVLAFADLSEARNGEYFSDGISEELLNVLAKVPGLKVAARTSSFYFKGKNLPIPEIASKLDVGYVVEGSVQRAGNRVKVTAQLIKADGFHVWSDTFTRDVKDVFALQEEIARLIATNLQLKLGAGAGTASATDPRTVDLYLRAREALRQRTNDGLEEAERLLKQALEIQPDFARAHATLADVWMLQWNNQELIGEFGQRNSPRLARIRAEIDAALELDPGLAEAHASLGALYLEEWKFPQAAAELRRATVLNPSYASAHQWLARALVADGRLDEALAEGQIAATLDPLSHRIQDNLSSFLNMAGRTEEALVVIERALAIKPDSDQALAFKAGYLDRLGRHEEALAAARRAVQLDPFWRDFLYDVFVNAGEQAEADAWPRSSGGNDARASFYRDLALGRAEQAVAGLDAERTNWRDAGGFLFGREYDTLRNDPRFVKFIDNLGLTEAYARARAWRGAHPQ
jgi:TolB-like protein/Tfp pilus assembly protein PilF